MVLLAFPPHIFSRFAERMEINFAGTKLMKRYFEMNNSYSFNFSTEEVDGVHRENVFATCRGRHCDGIQGCRLDIFLLKTSLTYDMCKRRTDREVAKSDEFRRLVHEEMSKVSQ